MVVGFSSSHWDYFLDVSADASYCHHQEMLWMSGSPEKGYCGHLHGERFSFRTFFWRSSEPGFEPGTFGLRVRHSNHYTTVTHGRFCLEILLLKLLRSKFYWLMIGWYFLFSDWSIFPVGASKYYYLSQHWDYWRAGRCFWYSYARTPWFFYAWFSVLCQLLCVIPLYDVIIIPRMLSYRWLFRLT